MKINKKRLLFCSFLVILINTSLCQSPPENNNLKFTLKVIEVKTKHLLILQLKTMTDTQLIKIHKEISYGNENNPIADCRFFIQKIIKNKLVSMYLNKLNYPSELNSSEAFKIITISNPLNDTLNIEDFIPLEIGQYIVSLELQYYLNGVQSIIRSNEEGFFVTNKSPGISNKKKKD